MNRRLLIIIAVAVILLILIAGGIFAYLKWVENKKLRDTLRDIGNGAEGIIDQATRGTVPSLQTNPLEDKPELNPAAKANPMDNVKTNPFE